MNKTKNLTIASMFLAIGIILPQAFHSIPNAGNILLPMHIPVLICGFICGPIYGLLVGLITPIVSHLIFAMPPVHMLSQMIIELGIYGLFTGLLNRKLNCANKLFQNYYVLIISMLIGRITYGLFNALIFQTNSYTLSMWLTSSFITGLPGMIIQLLIIPPIIASIKKLF